MKIEKPDTSKLFDIEPISINDVLHPRSLEAELLKNKGGIYCLYNHLDELIYIGETHSYKQGFQSRLKKHYSGSVNKGHFLVQYYNHNCFFVLGPPSYIKKCKNSELEDLFSLQKKENIEHNNKLKRKLIGNYCSIAMLPIDRGDLNDITYERLLKKKEKEAIYIGKEKGVSIKPKQFPISLIKAVTDLEDIGKLEEQNKIYIKFKDLVSKYPDDIFAKNFVA